MGQPQTQTGVNFNINMARGIKQMAPVNPSSDRLGYTPGKFASQLLKIFMIFFYRPWELQRY